MSGGNWDLGLNGAIYSGTTSARSSWKKGVATVEQRMINGVGSGEGETRVSVVRDGGRERE